MCFLGINLVKLKSYLISKMNMHKKQFVSTNRNALHNLMESALNAHRKDINDYSFGHLNMNNLMKPTKQEKTTENRWKSSAQKLDKKPSKTEVYDGNKLSDMSDALMDFSLGTERHLKTKGRKGQINAVDSEHMPVPCTTPDRADKRLERNVFREMERLLVGQEQSFLFEKEDTPKTSSRLRSKGQQKLLPLGTKPSAKIYVEELVLPEIMLSSTSIAGVTPPSLKVNRPEGRSWEAKKFVTTYHAGVTRRDQFQKIKDFERTILRKADTLERKAGDGNKAVEHLERKLVSRLLQLQLRNLQPGPSFERLQLYSEIWSDLSMDSMICGEILREIKHDYDEHLSHLLDSMKTSNRSELEQCLSVVESYSEEERALKCDRLREEVEEGERVGKKALKKNEELNDLIEIELKKIEEEEKLQREEEESVKRKLPLRRTDTKMSVRTPTNDNSKSVRRTTEQRLKALRCDVVDRLDAMTEHKNNLRNNFVPKSDLRNLQHAVKDTEVEMQKILQQNEYLAQIKEDLHQQLMLSCMKHKLNDDEKRWIMSKLEELDRKPEERESP